MILIFQYLPVLLSNLVKIQSNRHEIALIKTIQGQAMQDSFLLLIVAQKPDSSIQMLLILKSTVPTNKEMHFSML